MSMVMNMAKVTAKGQITIPADVREAIGIREGDKVLFVRMDDGSISLRNSSLEALQQAQQSFSEAAAEAGLRNEDDLASLIKQVRAERAEQVQPMRVMIDTNVLLSSIIFRSSSTVSVIRASTQGPQSCCSPHSSSRKLAQLLPVNGPSVAKLLNSICSN